MSRRQTVSLLLAGEPDGDMKALLRLLAFLGLRGFVWVENCISG